MSDSTTAVAPASTKVAKVKKVKVVPDYKTLTVKFNKDADEGKSYEAYDASGKQYTEADCPRQVMMMLAHKAKQVLYFRGKKWRRKSLVAKATVTSTSVPTSTTATVTA